MPQATKTLRSFIDENKMTMSVTPGSKATRPPGMQNMDAWTCVLHMDGRRLSTPFYMGVGHHGAEPDMQDVLDAMASDSVSIENARGFSDWCDEFGLDENERDSATVYRASQRQAEKLRSFLGQDLYDELLFDTERE